jgi:hypothetical protein
VTFFDFIILVHPFAIQPQDESHLRYNWRGWRWCNPTWTWGWHQQRDSWECWGQDRCLSSRKWCCSCWCSHCWGWWAVWSTHVGSCWYQSWQVCHGKGKPHCISFIWVALNNNLSALKSSQMDIQQSHHLCQSGGRLHQE